MAFYVSEIYLVWRSFAVVAKNVQGSVFFWTQCSVHNPSLTHHERVIFFTPESVVTTAPRPRNAGVWRVKGALCRWKKKF